MAETVCDPASLKYLLFGPFQKKCGNLRKKQGQQSPPDPGRFLHQMLRTQLDLQCQQHSPAALLGGCPDAWGSSSAWESSSAWW